MGKRMAVAAAVTTLFIAPSSAFGASGEDSPTATHDNPSSCLGAERAVRNSDGGDRAQGGFGTAQAAWIAEVRASGQNYGEWLAQWKAAC